jgi:hypothetical protein
LSRDLLAASDGSISSCSSASGARSTATGSTSCSAHRVRHSRGCLICREEQSLAPNRAPTRCCRRPEGTPSMGVFRRKRPANTPLPAEGERRDSNPRPPGPQPGTRFGLGRLVFRSTRPHMRPSSGSCHEACLRRSRSIPGDPLWFRAQSRGLGPKPRGGALPRGAVAPGDCLIPTKTGPRRPQTGPHHMKANVAPTRCALLEGTSTDSPLRLGPRSRIHGKGDV